MDTEDLGVTRHRFVLRADALYLGIAGAGGLLSDVLGIFFGHGPVSRLVAVAPHAGIGFIEAHTGSQ
jgi:hypothetical protein